MRTSRIAMLCALVMACSPEQAEEIEEMYPNETAKLEELIRKVGPLDLKKPELMTASERDRYVNAAYDRAAQGKQITIPVGQSETLRPGIYYYTPRSAAPTLQYTDVNGQGWLVAGDGYFSVHAVLQITCVGAITTLTYFPAKSPKGIPLTTTLPDAGGTVNVLIPFGGSGTAIERTAAAVFVRSFVITGPVNLAYGIAAGSDLTVSIDAQL